MVTLSSFEHETMYKEKLAESERNQRKKPEQEKFSTENNEDSSKVLNKQKNKD